MLRIAAGANLISAGPILDMVLKGGGTDKYEICTDVQKYSPLMMRQTEAGSEANSRRMY